MSHIIIEGNRTADAEGGYGKESGKPWTRVVDDGGRRATIAQMHKRGLSTEHVCRSVDDTTAETTAEDSAGQESPAGDGGGRERWLFPTVHKTGQPSAKAMTGDAVAMMIQRRAAAAGFTPAQVDLLGGHSLRSGFVTEAFRA